MNFYEHHIGDYAQATAHLSFVEDAAYSRLIRKYYAEEKPLPADIRAVQRLVGARSEEEREAVETVLGEFFALEADGWHSKRCDVEIERYREKQDKARASANSRWSRRNASASDLDANASKSHANASETHNGRNAHQSPDTTNNSLSHDDRLDLPGLSDHHPIEWQPDPSRLANELQRQGLPMPAPESLSRSLRRFNAHNEGKALTENLRYSKLATWLEGDHRREQTRPVVVPVAAGAAAPRKLTPLEQVRAARERELGAR